MALHTLQTTRSACVPCPNRNVLVNSCRRFQLHTFARCPSRVVSTQGSRRDLLSGVAVQLGVMLTAQAAAAAEGSDAVAPAVASTTTSLLTEDAAAAAMTPSAKQVYVLNKRVQSQNRAPTDFPGFIRDGFNIVVVGDGYVVEPSGVIYKDYKEGQGSNPVDGQEVVFDYTGYNESGGVIDSSYRQGRPSQTRLGIAGLIPGFELGIKGMKPGGKRRIIVPPELGPPVGPSTFFSAKQCEVFDVELRTIRTCERRQALMFSSVVCE